MGGVVTVFVLILALNSARAIRCFSESLSFVDDNCLFCEITEINSPVPQVHYSCVNDTNFGTDVLNKCIAGDLTEEGYSTLIKVCTTNLCNRDCVRQFVSTDWVHFLLVVGAITLCTLCIILCMCVIAMWPKKKKEASPEKPEEDITLPFN